MPVLEIIDAIEDQRISLADFQRDFDWSTPAIRALLATVLMGWPAGSLLLLEGDRTDLATRGFEGGPPPKANGGDIIVLDGQQRLTSLLHALTGWGSNYYGVPASAFRTGSVDDIEEGLTLLKEPARVPAPGIQADPESLLIPLDVLRTQKSFFRWRDQVLGPEPDGELSYSLSQAYRDHLHWLHDYEFATVTLDRSVEAPSVARIFERVNRTGLRLGSFDLVVARAYSREWNLRDRWAEARLEYPLLDDFLEDDGLPVLQAIALRDRLNVRQSAVLDLDPVEVSRLWQQSVDAVDQSLHFLAHHCGVVRPEWLPYRGIVLVLAGLALDVPLDQHVSRLRPYVISRSFALRFDVAANTRVVEDYRMLRQVVDGGSLEPIRRADDRDVLGATRQRRGALWRAFMCALVLNGARDPMDAPMRLATVSLPRAGSLDEPEARPTPVVARSDDGWHLRALSSVLASPTTAKRMRPLSAEASGQRFETEALSGTALASQFLPNGDELARLRRSPAELLKVRLSILDDWLRDAGGCSPSKADDA